MVTVNGEQTDAAGQRVADLLQEMKLNPQRTAVMIGGEILPKAEYDTVLSDGDTVDIIGFVGGG